MAINLRKTRWQNIYLSGSGVYYYRSRIAGKQITKSLKTTDSTMARIRAGEIREQETKLAIQRNYTDVHYKLSWGDCVNMWLERQRKRPDLSANGFRYYHYIAKDILGVVPQKCRVERVTYPMIESWWSEFSRSVSYSRANNALNVLRAVFEIQIEQGIRLDNPAKRLRRVRQQKKEMSMPTHNIFLDILGEIRKQARQKAGKGMSEAQIYQSADLIEFLAYSGCRVAEAATLTWEDVHKDWLHVTGKGDKVRRVYMIDDLKQLLSRLRSYWKGLEPTGQIFAVKAPRAALKGACSRLGHKKLRLHDLRHFFATRAIEAGVDIPTVAKWLGHVDGGVLAMSVYGHVRDQHIRDSARKILQPSPPRMGRGGTMKGIFYSSDSTGVFGDGGSSASGSFYTVSHGSEPSNANNGSFVVKSA